MMAIEGHHGLARAYAHVFTQPAAFRYERIIDRAQTGFRPGKHFLEVLFRGAQVSFRAEGLVRVNRNPGDTPCEIHSEAMLLLQPLAPFFLGGGAAAAYQFEPVFERTSGVLLKTCEHRLRPDDARVYVERRFDTRFRWHIPISVAAFTVTWLADL